MRENNIPFMFLLTLGRPDTVVPSFGRDHSVQNFEPTNHYPNGFNIWLIGNECLEVRRHKLRLLEGIDAGLFDCEWAD
mgnify:CR=1 FL=1